MGVVNKDRCKFQGWGGMISLTTGTFLSKIRGPKISDGVDRGPLPTGSMAIGVRVLWKRLVSHG
eukprot:748121-Hanusia_phi.AAC.7